MSLDSSQAAAEAPSTSNQKKTGSNFIKCPSHCRQNCAIRHHPLLVAVLNCNVTGRFEDSRLTDLKHVVNHYVERGWKVSDPIPDNVAMFRQPVLHWAASLGCIEAVSWLIELGVSPTLSSADSKNDTALHRALLSLQETCPKQPAAIYKDLLGLLELSLGESDVYGNTPLHSCAYMLVNDMPQFKYYKECFANMLRCIKSDITPNGVLPASDVLSHQNLDGDTVLHILVQNSTLCFDLTKCLLTMGARTDIPNVKGETPLLRANSSNQSSIVCLITEFLNTNGGDPNVIQQPGGVKVDETSSASLDEQPTTHELELVTHESQSVTHETEDDSHLQFMYTQDSQSTVELIATDSQDGVSSLSSLGLKEEHDLIEDDGNAREIQIDMAEPLQQDMGTDFDMDLEPETKQNDGRAAAVSLTTQDANMEETADVSKSDGGDNSEDGLSFDQTVVINVKMNEDRSEEDGLTPGADKLVTPVGNENGQNNEAELKDVTNDDDIGDEDDDESSSDEEVECQELKFSIHRGNTAVDLVGVEEILAFLRKCDLPTWQAFRATVAADSEKLEKSLKEKDEQIKACESVLQDINKKEADIDTAFKNHVKRLQSLYEEEDELTQNVRVLTEKLKNSEATQNGLLDRLSNCQAALGVLEEIQKPGLRYSSWTS